MEYIRELRKKAGLTQAELAEKAGIGANTIARYERGEKTPSITIAHSIAAALHVTEDELLNGPKKQEFEVKILLGVKSVVDFGGMEARDNQFLYGIDHEKPQIHLAGKIFVGTAEEREKALTELTARFREACWMFDHRGEAEAATGD